jgi:hypothetical protein
MSNSAAGSVDSRRESDGEAIRDNGKGPGSANGKGTPGKKGLGRWFRKSKA